MLCRRHRKCIYVLILCGFGLFIYSTQFRDYWPLPRDPELGILSDINVDVLFNDHNSATKGPAVPPPNTMPPAVPNKNSSKLLALFGRPGAVGDDNYQLSEESKERRQKLSRSLYLRPATTLYKELGLKWWYAEATQSRVMDVMRYGYGLRPKTCQNGQAGWAENGMVFRPWQEPKSPSAVEKKYPTPFRPDYDTFVPFEEEEFFETGDYDDDFLKRKKVILWHTPTKYVERKPGLHPMRACPDFPCLMATDLKYINQSAALVFAAQMVPPTPPPRSRRDQVFVLHNHEPPYENTFHLTIWEDGFKQEAWRSVFNWTMTYRSDSDIVVPYGIVRKRPKPVAGKDYHDIVDKKTKMVAWIVTNCKTASEREKYVDELKKYVRVDVFGGCGDMKCPRENDDACSQIINKEYKFYLSFESAICPEYVTEKFFRFLRLDTIVVARGDDQYFLHAPKEIFLNTADFPSPKELAKRMVDLHMDRSAYIAMLKEKDKYMALMEANPIRKENGRVRFMSYRFELVGFCQVCQRLWNLKHYRKRISNIHTWFDKKVCRKKKDF